MIVTIESIGETVTFDSGFQKREFVGVDNSNTEYPQPIRFEVTQQKVDFCGKINTNEIIVVCVTFLWFIYFVLKFENQ